MRRLPHDEMHMVGVAEMGLPRAQMLSTRSATSYAVVELLALETRVWHDSRGLSNDNQVWRASVDGIVCQQTEKFSSAAAIGRFRG